MCFLHGSEPLQAQLVGIQSFWYMHICTAPNPYSSYCHSPDGFGICVLFSSEPLLFDVSAGREVLAYVFLHGSEPNKIRFTPTGMFWYMCFFCTAPNLLPKCCHHFMVLVYVFFAQLRTCTFRCCVKFIVLVYVFFCTAPNRQNPKLYRFTLESSFFCK